MPGPVFKKKCDDGGVSPEGAVKYTEQFPTPSQQAQAQKNLGLTFTSPVIPNWGQELENALPF